MNEAQRVDHRRPSRLRLLGLTLGMLVLGADPTTTLLGGKSLPGAAFAGAPPTPTTAPEPVTSRTPGGIHFQVLTELLSESTEPAAEPSLSAVAIFLPRPPFDDWDSVSVSSNAPCLELGSLADPGPGYVLVQTATAVSENMAPAAEGAPTPATGMSCDAVVDVSFSSEPSTWQTSLSVHLFRPAAEPYQGDDIGASLSVSRIASDSTATPGAAGQRVLLLEVTVSNRTAEPIELLGLIDPSGITGATGRVFRIPDGRFLGTVKELQELAGSVQDIEIAPDDTARLGLVFDAEATLAQTAGTLSAQPAVLVRAAGESYSLLLNRVSTAWGDDLP